jgi:hypothetical protein
MAGIYASALQMSIDTGSATEPYPSVTGEKLNSYGASPHCVQLYTRRLFLRTIE